MRYLLFFAHGSSTDIAKDIDSLGLSSVLVSLLVLVVLLVIAGKTIKKVKFKSLKKLLFVLITLSVLVPTIILAGSSVYLTTVSDSRGPVHWKSGVEFWVCDQEIELRNPKGFFTNRIGSASLHEHDDKTIHVDGPVIDKEHDASLKKFLELAGGEITQSKLAIPTEDNVFENDTDGDENSGDQLIVANYVTKDNEGLNSVVVENGNSCLNNGGYGEVQAFVYSFDEANNYYVQEKLDQPDLFTVSEKAENVPGQCLIVEFDVVKDHTDKLCQSFGEIDSERCLAFGVIEYDPKTCRISEFKEQTTKIIPYKEAL